MSRRISRQSTGVGVEPPERRTTESCRKLPETLIDESLSGTTDGRTAVATRWITGPDRGGPETTYPRIIIRI